jgi:hypothetical protein
MATDVGTIVGYLTLDATQFDEAVTKAIAELKVLSGEDVKVKVDVSQLSQVKAASEEAVSGLDSVQTKAAQTDSSFSGHSRAMVTAIGLLGPALIPIAAGTAALGIGFAGMATAGIFAFKGVSDEMAKGTAVGLDYQHGLSVLGADMTHLADIAATNILGDFQQTVATLTARLPALSTEVGDLATLAGHAGSSILTGLVNVFQQLGPYMITVGVQIDQLAAKFETLSTTSGVKQFGNYLVAELPQVIQFIGDVIVAVERLVVAMAPFGGAILNVVMAFIEALNKIPVPMLENLATLAASVFAGFKAWEAISGIVEGVVTAVKALNTSIEISAATMRAFDIATGVFGIAVAAISLVLSAMSEKNQEAAASQEDLTQALITSNGAINDNVRLVALKNVQDAGMVENAAKLGLSASQVVNWYLGENSALTNLNAVRDAAMQKQLGLVNAGKANVSTIDDVMTASLNLRNEMNANGGAMAKARKDFEEQQEVLQKTTTTTDQATVAQQRHAAMLGITIPALKAAQAAEKQQAESAQEATTKMQLENNAAGLLKQALDALNGKAISAAQAQNNFESALIGMTGASKKSKAAADGAGASIRGMSQQSVDARQSLLQQTQAAFSSAEANGDLSGSNEHARSTLIALREKIIANAVAHGYNRSQVQSYIDTVFKIPKNASTLLTVKDQAALNALNNFQAQVDNLHGKSVTIYTRHLTDNIVNNYNGVGGASGHGELTKFYGGIEHFREGGIMHMAMGGNLPSSAIIAPDGANLVNWAEAGTGGEAFIPLGTYNRQRSIDVWEQTGRALGVAPASSSLVGIQIVGTLQTPWGPSQIKAVVQSELNNQAAAAQVSNRALNGVQRTGRVTS